MTAVLTVASCGSAAVVRIEGSEGSWRLTRNGEPYFIRGGGGGGSKALLREIGGNSFRTWGADAAKRDLDEGAKHGLTVSLASGSDITGMGSTISTGRRLRMRSAGFSRP